MIGSSLYQRIAGESAEAQQLFGIMKRYDLIRAAVKNDSSGFHHANGSKPAPCRAYQNQSHGGLLQVHSHRSAPAGSDDHLRSVLIHFVLGDSHRLRKIVVRQFRIEHHVPALLEKDRLNATRNGLPSVQEKNLHEGILLATRIQQSVHFFIPIQDHSQRRWEDLQEPVRRRIRDRLIQQKSAIR